MLDILASHYSVHVCVCVIQASTQADRFFGHSAQEKQTRQGTCCRNVTEKGPGFNSIAHLQLPKVIAILLRDAGCFGRLEWPTGSWAQPTDALAVRVLRY